ncbi:MAG: hypothetical protein IBX43_01360 [Campylobacterales bacterium]|nr:hypothetical protein [Campylobacterales bacterium]
MPTYPLKTILDSISTTKQKSIHKRILYNQAPLGGISSMLIVLFFFSLPFVEFALIFNPLVFEALGIAQSIIFFIVFLSIVMIIVFLVSWMNNTAVLKKISPSWSHYFPHVDLKMLLSSGTTPYSSFFHEYAKIGTSLEDAQLHAALQKTFTKMQEENKELIEAMQNDRSRKV